jgi:large subunit ribosomal protein L15
MGLELNNLKPPEGSKKVRKRVGRGPGSRRGTYSGRGVKGQKSRSGSSTRPGFEGGQTPLIKRIPKRGFRRKSHIEYSIINIRDLNRFKNKDEITIERLKEENIIEGNRPVKILGDGKLDKKLVVHANKFSKNARDKIEKAGGEVVEHV